LSRLTLWSDPAGQTISSTATSKPWPGLRNGYEPGRLRSAEGELRVQVPQVRGPETPYWSKLMEFLRGSGDVLNELF
jgi:hypothetical protein